MSGIKRIFASLSERKEGAYIPYLCTGDPNPTFSLGMIETLCESGADIIELGMPFSDPMADGPLLQEAMNRSLKGSFRTELLFEMIENMRRTGLDQPVVVMGYYNIVHHMGEEEFCRRLSEAGGDGAIVVDLPIEESSSLDERCMKNGIDLVNLISPNTSLNRRQMILERSRGYAYLVSVAGVTGPRDVLSESTLRMVREIASNSPLPIALGFGISSPDQARAAFEHGASGIVEGSSIAAIYSSHLRDMESALEALGDHARSMKRALSNGKGKDSLDFSE